MNNRIGGSSNLLTASSQASTGFVRALSSINSMLNEMKYLNVSVVCGKAKKRGVVIE